MLVNDLVAICDQWLEPGKYKDYCVNGLQVACSNKECRHIATAVTACQDAVEQAADLRVDALLVHHGLFWHGDLSIVDLSYKRLKPLILNDIALIAYHLPLDEHESYGNNVQLGLKLGIEKSMQYDLAIMKPTLGRYANCDFSRPDLTNRLTQITDREPVNFVFGPKDCRRIAWCTGAAQDGILQAKKVGADTYISGEVSERTFHYAKEYGINYFCIGHHASERFGVQALAAALSDSYDLMHTYIEIFNPV